MIHGLLADQANTSPNTIKSSEDKFLIASDVPPAGNADVVLWFGTWTVVNSAVLGSGGPKHVLPSAKSSSEQLRKIGHETLFASRTSSQGGLTYSQRLRHGFSFVGLLFSRELL